MLHFQRCNVRGPDGATLHTGGYLIGADGGRSTVRKQCGIPFEGFTWPERFVVFSTPFDFDEFIERKRQGKKGSLSRSRLDTGSKPRY